MHVRHHRCTKKVVRNKLFRGDFRFWVGKKLKAEEINVKRQSGSAQMPRLHSRASSVSIRCLTRGVGAETPFRFFGCWNLQSWRLLLAVAMLAMAQQNPFGSPAAAVAAKGESPTVLENPLYYCDACVATLEEFHWNMQDGLSAETRGQMGVSKASAEVRLDMVKAAEHLCKPAQTPRMSRYRADIVDGCNQLMSTNLRPLILEFTGAVPSEDVTHARTQSFCASKLAVCPGAELGLPSVTSFTQCPQCVLLVKDIWGMLNRFKQCTPPLTDVNDRSCSKQARSDVWDVLERTCDGLVLRYPASHSAKAVDLCMDILSDHDTSIAENVLLARRKFVAEKSSISLPLASRLREAPMSTFEEREVVLSLTSTICINVSGLCAPDYFIDAFRSTAASPWLMVRNSN